jgi:hypothetical protein
MVSRRWKPRASSAPKPNRATPGTYMASLAQTLDPAAVAEVLQALLDKAKAGDVRAAIEVLRRVFGAESPGLIGNPEDMDRPELVAAVLQALVQTDAGRQAMFAALNSTVRADVPGERTDDDPST